MTNSGTAMLGVGAASGKDRAQAAALAATSAPLLQRSIEKATGAQSVHSCYMSFKFYIQHFHLKC